MPQIDAAMIEKESLKFYHRGQATNSQLATLLNEYNGCKLSFSGGNHV
jgi:hypothetical protein